MYTRDAPKLIKVTRLDSMPVQKAQYTPEGYLVDRPILTSVGIFEYTNADGTQRRELRLPEEVFDPASLASYRGRPIIVTHDAGLVTKDNVHENQIGTILSAGYQDGEDVRAEIIIHDTDEMKESGLKELSLGYNLDLDETPGVWKGQRYDAIQRNIRINHLALVREARAGDQARLNIDSRDNVLKGGKLMKRKVKRTRRADGILTSEELKKAIEQYKARKAQRVAAKADEDDEPVTDPAAKPAAKVTPKQSDKVSAALKANKPATKPAAVTEDDDEELAPAAPADDVKHDEDAPVEDRVAAVKENRDRRDQDDDPKNLQQAEGIIADQDDDISVLFDIIDTLLAEKEFDEAGEEEKEENAVPTGDDDETVQDPDAEDCTYDDDEEEQPVAEDDDDLTEDPDNEDDDEEEPDAEDDDDLAEDPDNEDDDEEDPYAEDDDEEEDPDNEDDDDDIIPSRDPSNTNKAMNADSIDRLVRARVKIDRCARQLNMDGLEFMPIMKAKKKIIRKVRPGMRLDGKSHAYINAAFDQAYDEVNRRSRKDTNYQKKQMFNKDSRSSGRRRRDDSAAAHRRKMIARRQKNS